MGKLVSVASVVLTLPLYVTKLPQRGSASMASASATGIGDGADVMISAAKQGVRVLNSSCLGTGPNSVQARRELNKCGILTVTNEVVGDIGLKILMIEHGGYYASVVNPGVEADVSEADLFAVQLEEGDAVYVNAGDLVHPTYRETLMRWLPEVPENITIVMAMTPMVGNAPKDAVLSLMSQVDIVTANETEACYIVGNQTGFSCDFVRDFLREGAVAVQRQGAAGARVIKTDEDVFVPSVDVDVIDTLGVGAAHTGVMLASLLQGQDVVNAVQRANIAGALAASRIGNNSCPSAQEINDFIKRLQTA